MEEAIIIRGTDGKFQQGTKSPKPITSDNAREMQRKGVLAKRAVALAEANRSVEDMELIDRYGEHAYIAAITRTQMQIATTPEAGKAAKLSADWLVDNTGLSEKALVQNIDGGQMSPLELAMASLIEAVTSKVKQAGVDVIDAEATDE